MMDVITHVRFFFDIFASGTSLGFVLNSACFLHVFTLIGQAMLTRVNEYEGGGTYFRCLRKTVKLQQGQVLVNPGELYHKGLDITSGVRCLLVCFTDGLDPKILDDSKPEDDGVEYEKNVVFI
mmetsp:Transcript_2210/g.4752  ORF Transcript_2210/g.4752 Transcript_2210/m.4752 type:complete len:123 (-) Transcript_2210:336-704(-)